MLICTRMDKEIKVDVKDWVNDKDVISHGIEYICDVCDTVDPCHIMYNAARHHLQRGQVVERKCKKCDQSTRHIIKDIFNILTPFPIEKGSNGVMVLFEVDGEPLMAKDKIEQ